MIKWVVKLGVAACVTVALGVPVLADSAPAEKPVEHSAPAPDGPFGIRMGESLAELGSVTKMPADTYVVRRPPKANSQFESVAVVAYPETGVCMILAATPSFAADLAAEQAIRTADSLADTLTPKYGAPAIKRDECTAGDSVCDSFFTAELSKGDATYGYYWDYTKAPRPDHIWKLSVTLGASNASAPFVALTYIGDSPACLRLERASDAADKSEGL